MTELTIEQRVAVLESEVAFLKKELKGAAVNPWLQIRGMFKDDPLFDDWQKAIAEYRQQLDADPDVR